MRPRRSCPGRSTATASDGTQQRVGRLLEQPSGLCDPCLAVVGDALRALPGDYVRLYAELQPGRGGDSDKVSGTREAPLPFRAGHRDLAARIAYTAVTWAEPLAEATGVELRIRAFAHAVADGTFRHRTTRPDRALAAATRLLTAHTPRLLALPEMLVRTWAPGGHEWAWCRQSGLDGALELHDLHHLADIQLGLTELQHRLPAPCPRCEAMTLVRDNGAATVRCTRGCVSWPESDYQRLTLVLADDLATAS